MVKKPSESPTSRRRRIGTKARIVLVITVVLILAHHLLVRAIDARLEAARSDPALGQPLEIDPYWPPPDLPVGAVNATDFIESAVLLTAGQQQAASADRAEQPTAIAALYRRFRQLEVGRDRPTAQDLAHFRAALDRHALALEVIDRGLDAATGARYAADDKAHPLQVQVPNLLARLHLTALFRARAMVAVDEGRGDDAWRDAVRVFQLAEWTRIDMPTLINALVARAMFHQGALLTQFLVDEAPGTAEIRAPVAAWVGRANVVEVLNRLLGAERAVGYDYLRSPRIGWPDLGVVQTGLGIGLQRWVFGWRPWRRLNAALYLEAATPQFARCSRPSHEIRDTEPGGEPALPPAWALPASRQIFDCLDVAHKRDLWLAEQRLIVQALELESIREQGGDYPEALAAAATDPFSGTTLRYRKEADGYALYSVSINGQDDGGAAPPPGERGFPDFAEGDLLWRVTRNPVGGAAASGS